ncbi:MAG: phosphate ABC transporter substrate-binding protein PstS [Nocardioides sp.]|uniref:phosphate ABC transporter substrate-binding protein PstS n=1 Tax=Nocardioides sp. TaxID=35761 RepID=UPI0039E4430F
MPGHPSGGARYGENRRIRANRLTAALAALATAGLLLLGTGPASADGSLTPITGEGSSWAGNAIDTWRAAVSQSMRVNFAATGSVAGLTGFASGGSDDFAASDIPYGVQDTSPDPPGRAFAYIPDVAGGTAFMYNLTVNGKRFTNLKLSGDVIAAIFAGKITKWNDAKITAQNPGVALPPLKITPVVRSDGSGSTAQLTLWMEKQFPSVWTCGQLSFFTKCSSYSPTVHQAKSGDNGVAGFVAQASNAGSIGYVEYSYALQSNFPVAKVLNKAGFYVLPTAENVAVALQKATINTNKGDLKNYLTQQLDGVFAYTDPRSYPVSSYSYFVVPTAAQSGFTTEKGKTLSSFINYALCQGQQAMKALGYSPLPKNLVQAGLDQVKLIPGASATISISSCTGNPTFSSDGTNTLAKTAPYPDLCDKSDAAATCVYGTLYSASGSTKSGTTKSSSSGSSTTSGTSSGGTGTTTDGTASTDPGAVADPAAVGDQSVAGGTTGGLTTILNPDGKTSCDQDTGQCTELAATPIEVAASQGAGVSKWAVWLMIAALMLLILAPPAVVLSARRKRS